MRPGRPATARERLIERDERLRDVVADLLERQLVELVHDLDQRRFDRFEVARNQRQHEAALFNLFLILHLVKSSIAL